jgi:CheY-like chemotaxis protein
MCVDDEREVLTAVEKDLEVFAEHGINVEPCSSVSEARSVLEAMEPGQLALIFCDHLMPGVKGVDFLIELAQNPATNRSKKVLLTGQAGQKETIQAINFAHIDQYIPKPWSGNGLRSIAKNLLTDYIIAVDEHPERFGPVLDFGKIMEAIHARNL